MGFLFCKFWGIIITIKTPWSSVGYLTFARTYARKNLETGKLESWEETIDRVIKGSKEQLRVPFEDGEAERLKKYMLELKASVAGRFLWQLGTRTVEDLGLASLQNCSFTVVNDPIKPFTWAFDFLMLGSGVGYNIQREHVYKLPPVSEDFCAPTRLDTNDADFIVPDSRQGWVRLLEYTLRAAFKRGKNNLTYSTILVRGKGAPIKGFGGVASGPEDLCWGIGEISKVLSSRKGKQLRPIDCLDMMNIIGMIVVSGNVKAN